VAVVRHNTANFFACEIDLYAMTTFPVFSVFLFGGDDLNFEFTFARPPSWMKMGVVLDGFVRMEVDPQRIRGRSSVGAFIARL
jgi:hypothetical protein